MSFKKKALLTTATMTAIAVPLISVVSCNSFFKDHELFDNGNFVFEYIQDTTKDGEANEFNHELVSKDKFLFGASLGASEIYNTNGVKPQIIGISPEKSLTANGLFMSNTFSRNDMVDFSNYMQYLWWASSWAKGGRAPFFENKPSEVQDVQTPSSEYESEILNHFEKDEYGNTSSIFKTRQSSVTQGGDLGIFQDGSFQINTYYDLFSKMDMQHPLLYKPGSTIETTYGVKNTFGNSVNNSDDILTPAILSPYSPATYTTPGGNIDFDKNGEINNRDIADFLNKYAPYTYANYIPFTQTNPTNGQKIRLVIHSDAFKPVNDPNLTSTQIKAENLRLAQKLASIMANDGIPIDTVNGVYVIDDTYIEDAKKQGVIEMLNDPAYKTISIMPITEWASIDDNSSSLVASYRIPARLSSLSAEFDSEGNLDHLDGSKFRIDESYALGLITTYFNLWIDNGQDYNLERRNYGLDELSSIISGLNGLDWTPEDREYYYNNLRDLSFIYTASVPKSDMDPATPEVSEFYPASINYDFENHELIDDVNSHIFSTGINPFIYYSTNSDGLSDQMDKNSQIIENVIINHHDAEKVGDGKINLRDEILLPIHVALYRAESFGDANITESVKAWIKEHFIIE